MAGKREVSSTYNSPGPAYALPSLTGYHNHDPLSGHPKYPAYSLGQRRHSTGVSKTPGPYNDQNAVKYTRPSPPRCGIRGRSKDDTVVDRSKIPAAYKGIDTDYSVTNKPPRYSMAGRHPSLKIDSSPG